MSSGEITAAQMAGYVATYATQRRAVYRWVAIGREKNDAPPLDDPSAMLAWWQRCMKQRPPDKILAAAEKKATAPGSPAAAPSTPAPAAASAPDVAPDPHAKKVATSTPVDFSSIEGVGLAAAVKQLQLQLAAHQAALFEAMTKGADESTLALRQRNVNVTLDLLRKCESTLDDQRKSRGDLIEIADVQEDWGMLLTALAAMRERMCADIEEALAATRDESGAAIPFSRAQLAAVRAAVLTVRAREDKLLRGAKHWAHDEFQRTAA